MSTGDPKGDKRRPERLGAEGAKQRRRRQLVRLGAVAAASVVLVVAAILIARSGADEPSAGATDSSGVVGAAETTAMLDGIPQSGGVLGARGARVTLVEYADLQCPFCRDYALAVVPTLVDRYVRPGKVRLEVRLLRFLGPDSDRAARAAVVAGRKRRQWNFIDLFYRNQGDEGSGYATDEFVRRLGAAIPGIDSAALIADAGAPEVERELVAAEAAAEASKIESTPTFEIVRGDAPPKRLNVTSLEPQVFTQALDAALKERARE